MGLSMIVAMTKDGVIAKDGAIPWHYKGDMKRFRELTMGSTVIMGRKTWETLGGPLEGRTNVAMSRELFRLRRPEGVWQTGSIDMVMRNLPGPFWCIGGAEIYKLAMPYCNLIDVTYVPDEVGGGKLTRFPEIDPLVFQRGPVLPHEYEPTLTRQVFTRRWPV